MALAVDGERDRSTAFTVAVAVGAPSNPELRCSGVLIDPEVVLTVRHCVEALPSPDDVDCATATFAPSKTSPEDLWVTAARDIQDIPATWYQVRSAVFPKTNGMCGSDLALLRLEQPLSSHEASPAELAVSPESFESALASGYFGAVGYGATSPTAEDAGIRRGRWDVPILCVRGDRRFSCADHAENTVPFELVSGPASCSGDSGSGAIDVALRTRVFGVLSRGVGAGELCPRGIYERTDAWAWLIGSSVLDVAEERGQGDAPDWAKSLFPAAGESAPAGGLCRHEAECEQGQSCLSVNGARSFVCAPPCQTDDECPADFGCLADGADGHCFANVARESPPPSGCSLSPDARSSSGWLVLAGLASALQLVMRRRYQGQRATGEPLSSCGCGLAHATDIAFVMRRYALGWLAVPLFVVGTSCSGSGFSGAMMADAGRAGRGGANGGGVSGGSSGGTQAGDPGQAGASSSDDAGASSGGSPSVDCEVMYVAPTGDDNHDGCAPESPKMTVASALLAASSPSDLPRTIKVCAGVYPEAGLTIDSPITLLGGFDCESWRRDALFGFDHDFASEHESLIENANVAASAATLTISGEAVTATLVEGFSLPGADSADTATRGVLVTSGASPVLRNNRISGGAGQAPSAPSVGVFIAEGAAPELFKNVIDGGSGETPDEDRGSVGVLVQKGAGSARIHENRISGGDGATAGAINLGSVGLLVRAEGPFSGPAAIAGNIIDGGSGTGAGTTGLLIEGNVTAEVSDNQISAGAGGWNGTSTKVTCVALMATQAGALRVSGNRIYGGDCDASGTVTVVAKGLDLFETHGAVVDNNFIHGGNRAGVGGYARALLLTGAHDAVIRNNTILSGLTGPGVSAEGPDNAIALLLSPGTQAAIIVNNLLLTSQLAESSGVYINGACSPAGISDFSNNALFGMGTLGFVGGDGCTPSGTSATAVAFEAQLSTTMVEAPPFVAANRHIASACVSGDSSCVARVGCTSPQACLQDTFAEFSNDAGFATLFSAGYKYPSATAACALTQGGKSLAPDLTSDGFGAPRTAPFSLGAHEQDGACE